MKNIKVENAINTLAKLVQIDDKKRKELIDKYSNLSDVETIKELSQLVYRLFSSNDELYNYSLKVIRNINENICPPIDEMKQKLLNMFTNNIEGNMSLEGNHQLVIKSLTIFTKLFNEAEIDYYIVGALPCFIKTGQSLFRYHDDIDIMVNEEDIPKIAEIIKLSGYTFYDDRFPSLERVQEMQKNKPPHTVLAQNPNNEFHLGFFTFRREHDNSITTREYSHRIENNQVVIDVLERISDPIGTCLRYEDIPTQYNGTTFKTSTVESVYNLKTYTKRPKDITDIKKLEPYINKEKLAQIHKHPQQNITIQNIFKVNLQDNSNN